MPFAVQREDGKFLGRGTGWRRSWVSDLDDADLWKSEGRAKVSYNHAVATAKRHNENCIRYAAYPSYRDAKPMDVPAFKAVEVRVSVVGEPV